MHTNFKRKVDEYTANSVVTKNTSSKCNVHSDEIELLRSLVGPVEYATFELWLQKFHLQASFYPNPNLTRPLRFSLEDFSLVKDSRQLKGMMLRWHGKSTINKVRNRQLYCKGATELNLIVEKIKKLKELKVAKLNAIDKVKRRILLLEETKIRNRTKVDSLHNQVTNIKLQVSSLKYILLRFEDLAQVQSLNRLPQFYNSFVKLNFQEYFDNNLVQFKLELKGNLKAVQSYANLLMKTTTQAEGESSLDYNKLFKLVQGQVLIRKVELKKLNRKNQLLEKQVDEKLDSIVKKFRLSSNLRINLKTFLVNCSNKGSFEQVSNTFDSLDHSLSFLKFECRVQNLEKLKLSCKSYLSDIEVQTKLYQSQLTTLTKNTLHLLTTSQQLKAKMEATVVQLKPKISLCYQNCFQFLQLSLTPILNTTLLPHPKSIPNCSLDLHQQLYELEGSELTHLSRSYLNQPISSLIKTLDKIHHKVQLKVNKTTPRSSFNLANEEMDLDTSISSLTFTDLNSSFKLDLNTKPTTNLHNYQLKELLTLSTDSQTKVDQLSAKGSVFDSGLRSKFWSLSDRLEKVIQLERLASTLTQEKLVVESWSKEI